MQQFYGSIYEKLPNNQNLILNCKYRTETHSAKIIHIKNKQKLRNYQMNEEKTFGDRFQGII